MGFVTIVCTCALPSPETLIHRILMLAKRKAGASLSKIGLRHFLFLLSSANEVEREVLGVTCSTGT
jgi:hypothetical protein